MNLIKIAGRNRTIPPLKHYESSTFEKKNPLITHLSLKTTSLASKIHKFYDLLR